MKIILSSSFCLAVYFAFSLYSMNNPLALVNNTIALERTISNVAQQIAIPAKTKQEMEKQIKQICGYYVRMLSMLHDRQINVMVFSRRIRAATYGRLDTEEIEILDRLYDGTYDNQELIEFVENRLRDLLNHAGQSVLHNRAFIHVLNPNFYYTYIERSVNEQFSEGAEVLPEEIDYIEADERRVKEEEKEFKRALKIIENTH